MKTRYLLLILLLIWAGCQKEDEPAPPIVEPGPYYPVYPGSWWKYVINDSTVVIDSTSDDYMIHSFRCGPYYGDGPEEYTNPKRVPFLNGRPIYGYYYVEEIGYPETNKQGIHELYPILSEQIGYSFWPYFSDHRWPYPAEYVTVKGKAFNGVDSVLYLESGATNVYQMPQYLFPEIRYRTFTKGIGLTSDIKVDTVTSDTLYKKILIDYFVNHSY